ncbi:MAG TPA: CBS domain-containing protein, partial [Myxococcales bacterium]|nr:CBS domain-containing protein [Myxococcales bacterium]
PLLVACGTAVALVHGVLGASIYQLGARRRGVRFGNTEASLKDLSVAQAVDKIAPLQASLPFAELFSTLGATPHAAFPVVDAAGVVGVLSVREVRRALLDPGVDRTATARSFTKTAELLLADDDLGTAVQRMSDAGVSEALVLDDEKKPMGIVTREGILEAWRKATTPP